MMKPDTSQILEAKGAKASVNESTQKQAHLTTSQQNDLLANLLSEFGKPSDGKLGLHPHCQLHLDLLSRVQNPRVKDLIHGQKSIFQTHESSNC